MAIKPGRWSLAVGREMSIRVDGRDGKREQFRRDSGISKGRLPKILNGDQAWYLEDVDVACGALGLDVIDFLSSLDP